MFLRIRKRDLGVKICAHFSLLGLGKVTGHPKVNVFHRNSLKKPFEGLDKNTGHKFNYGNK